MAVGMVNQMKPKEIATKLLWVDLEMTGLDPQKQRIIEVAMVAADFGHTELGRYEAVIHQPDRVLDAAEDWPIENMQALFDESRKSTTSEDQVVEEICQFIDKHFEGEPVILAGNSVHQDRRFIRQWWPKVDKLLHYRMFDVTTFKIWVQSSLGQEYSKQENHRATDDILESIEELRWCLEQLQNNPSYDNK